MAAEYGESGDEEMDAEVVPIRRDEDADPDLLPAIPDDPPRRVPEPAIPPAIAEGERKPVIPLPLQPGNLKGTLVQFAGVNWHRSRYHGLRLPVYLIAHLVWAVIGTCRLAIALCRWGFLSEQFPLRSEAVIANDSREWRALHKEAKATRRFRGTVIAVFAVLALIAALVTTYMAPRWAQYAIAAVAALVLAYTGKPRGHRIVGTAVVPPEYEIPTPEVITRGLGSLGISALEKAAADGGITFVSDVHRDGPGWAAHIDLPFGVTPSMILARRARLASGLRRPLSAVWPEEVPGEHAGRLYLWIGFQDMAKLRPLRHPLAKTGTADVFGSVPFGTDPRQRPITAPLFEVNWLIGASPGQGKTNVVRNLLSAAALDPLCDLWVHELAGKGDLEPFAQVSHRYVSGLDDESVGYAADSARRLRAELDKRSEIFKGLPRERKPDGKLTRELAASDPRLRPIVAAFDEAQVLFLHPEFGSQSAADLAHLMRLARAYGIIILLSTQRPDKDSVPTSISGVVTARACLKVPDQVSNDMVLGTGAYKAGYDATVFRAKTDAGLSWLKGDAEPQVARSYYQNLPDTEKVCARARQIRERAGVLSGYALGEDESRPQRDVLADVLAVLGDRSGMQWGTLAEALALRFPDRYHDVTAESISAQCRALSVPSVDVRADGAVLKGCRKAGVVRAVAR